MFHFLHGYLPGFWEAQVREGIVGENDGIRFCQNILLNENLKFNKLAAVGGELHKILSERKCVLYIDRLQGGCYIDEYPYDMELIETYKELLGENFWGFQMHEWMNNYIYDATVKLKDLPKERWTEEEITKVISEKFPYPYLLLEAATAKEMAELGKPETVQDIYRNVTEIYKKRLEVGELIPCDSCYLAYGFEVSCGAKRLMPEVGAQSMNARIQIRYARGMTRAEGRSFGVYYEPWGGQPFSACCYQRDGKNEWGIGEAADFPFKTQGENGGSSRSLQRRVFLYGFLCGAEFMSEEWGVCNAFYDWKDYELSPYGQVKKEFLEFTRKYTDIGEILTPMAVVLPKDLMVLNNLDQNSYLNLKFSTCSEEVAQSVLEVFASSQPMLGTEQRTFKNSDIPDAIDLLNADESVLGRYQWLVDLTCDESFAEKHDNICQISEIKEKLREALPCHVEGNAHWLVNERIGGGYYLTVFNHSGIERTVANGEVELPEAETTVTVSFPEEATPALLEGNGNLQLSENVYKLTIPAGGWAFIRF